MRQFIAALVLAAGSAAIFPADPAHVVEDVRLAPAPALDEQPGDRRSAIAYFAGGCFWGVQGVFQHTAGVLKAVSGYAGGDKSTAMYEIVSTGATGHAEAVQVTYDPGRISYGKILQIYFSVVHDPTQLNRQGPDVGTQYRSAVFAQTEEQKQIADSYIAELNAAKVYSKPIVTRVDMAKGFYPAEAYHQDYLVRHPEQPYIVFHDLPKVRNLKKMFADYYVEKPTLVGDVAAN